MLKVQLSTFELDGIMSKSQVFREVLVRVQWAGQGMLHGKQNFNRACKHEFYLGKEEGKMLQGRTIKKTRLCLGIQAGFILRGNWYSFRNYHTQFQHMCPNQVFGNTRKKNNYQKAISFFYFLPPPAPLP